MHESMKDWKLPPPTFQIIPARSNVRNCNGPNDRILNQKWQIFGVAINFRSLTVIRVPVPLALLGKRRSVKELARRKCNSEPLIAADDDRPSTPCRPDAISSRNRGTMRIPEIEKAQRLICWAFSAFDVKGKSGGVDGTRCYQPTKLSPEPVSSFSGVAAL